MISTRKAAILAALPGTAADIAAATGISLTQVYKGLNKLKHEGGLHVADWRVVKGHGRDAAVFKAGPGQDKPQPEPVLGTPCKNRPAVERRKSARPFGSATASLAGGLFPGCS